MPLTGFHNRLGWFESYEDGIREDTFLPKMTNNAGPMHHAVSVSKFSCFSTHMVLKIITKDTL